MRSNVVERFLRYVKVDTQSDENSDTFPSTGKQKVFAKMLAEELQSIGVQQVYFDETYGYVYAAIPSNLTEEETKKGTVLGFIAHMDTSPEVSGKDVKPQIVEHYNGKDILLNEEANCVLSVKVFPELTQYIGKTLITTDGMTLLGADDKAGVAEIMTMAEQLLQNPDMKHGRIAIAFTPDEEVGGGMDHFDVERFGADYAYTVDGGALGELEYENFNAAKAVIDVRGRSVHPGDAKDKMKNAALLAAEFMARLPKEERPEHTEGYQGFYHLTDLKGCVEQAQLAYIIRDHDREKFEQKKQNIQNICGVLNKKYGEGSFCAEITDQYYNMKEKIKPCIFLVENAKKCMEELGITPRIQPIRGGTDGARLSFMGVPCPNLCAGGHNFHGRYEYCCAESLEKITELLILLAKSGNNDH